MLYTGLLHVEPNRFSLNVEQMSVRHNEIGLDIHGRLNPEMTPYEFHGTAMKQPEGHFRADQTEWSEGIEWETSIYLFPPKCSPDECEVEGFWYERAVGGDTTVWRFSGSLNPF